MNAQRLASMCAAVLALGALASCTDNDASTGDAIEVISTDDECKVATDEMAAGTLTFNVRNDGDKPTEFYLLGEDGQQIIGEVENIGPGLERKLVVIADEGSYITACKPGMTGDGIRAPFTVTEGDAAAAPESSELLTAATDQYALYVEEQAEDLQEQTAEFARLYKAGDDDAARTLYPIARTPWERIEPVAESFGDLDPRLDLREADLAEGQNWTGWHRIEKDLWPPDGYTPMTTDERAEIADQLVADTDELVERIEALTYSPDQLGNGAKELLDEVATGKVTGEEEFWSHTDLWDFQANVDGARVAFEDLEPVLDEKNPELADTLNERFAALQTILDQYKVDAPDAPDGYGFVSYTELTPDQVKELSDAVNALSEPLSELTAEVLA